MTKDEIIKRVEWMTKSSVELSQPVLVYNDGFKDGANFVLQNLQQTACYTTLELLEQKLKEATEAVVPSDDEVGLMEKDSEIAYLNQVIEYIKDLQANVV